MKTKISIINRIICVMIAVIIMIPAFPVSAVSNLKVGQDCINLIKETEGFSKYKYWDYSQYTIGYGTRCEANEYPDGITEEEAEKLLKKYADAFGDYVNDFANDYNIKLTQNQFDALVCLTYALGNLWDAYGDFDLKTILINGSERYSFLQIAQAFGEWRKAGGKVLQGLVERRQKEIKLFLKNREEPEAEVWRVNSDDGLNLRSGPGTDHSKIGFMTYNTIFSVTEKVTGSDGNLWGKTVYEGKEQWCSLKYCSYYVGGPLPVDGKAPAVTTVSSSSGGTSDPGNTTEVSEQWKITSDNGVKLRSGPGLNYQQVGFVDYNQKITVTQKTKADGYQWGKTTVDGKTGWCVLDYAELISSQQIQGSTLKSIYIETKPKKVKYIEGEKLDTTGMVVMAVYSDGSEQKISDYDLSGFESKEGSYNVTVTYMKKTAMFTVTVEKRQLMGIEVDSKPDKTVYKTGEGLSIKGLKVNGIYEGDVILPIGDFFLDGVDGFSETAGTKKITIISENFKTQFEVEVTEKELTSIEITNLPTVTEYAFGQELDTEGMVVHAYYNNGRKNAVTDYTISGYNPMKSGVQTVVVSYSEFKDTFSVVVGEKDNSELAGDLDGNGERTVFDLVLLNKHLNGEKVLDSDKEYLADVNLDGYVDKKDVEALSRIISEQ